MENNTVTKFKIFTVADYEKEESFLREMANRGLHLIKIRPTLYTFRRGEPKDIVYRLDYDNYKNDEKAEYIKLFEDYGWEYLWEFFGWSYFRKDAKDANIEIFSDNQSRLNLVKKVFLTRMLPILIIFFVVIIPGLLENIEGKYVAFRDNEFLIVFGSLFILYLIIILYVGFGLIKLNQKYSKRDKI